MLRRPKFLSAALGVTQIKFQASLPAIRHSFFKCEMHKANEDVVCKDILSLFRSHTMQRSYFLFQSVFLFYSSSNIHHLYYYHVVEHVAECTRELSKDAG